MDRFLAALSTLFFLAGSFRAWGVLRAGGRGPGAAWGGAVDYGLNAAGFAAQLGFLLARGARTGHCPVTNVFEVAMFVCWSVSLCYLLVGASYRMSPLGLFTAPFLFLAQTAALLLLPDPVAAGPRGGALFWVETHAALSLMAYGAFGLAAVAGVVFLVQDAKLRARQPDAALYALPPVAGLGRVITRLMAAGFVMLSAGLASGFAGGLPAAWVKLASGGVVWAVYAGVLALRLIARPGARRAAFVAIAAFALALISLGGMETVTAVYSTTRSIRSAP